MANTFAPFGFLHTAYGEGAAPTFGRQKKLIAYNNNTAIFSGDPVKLIAGTGYITQMAAGDSNVLLAGIFDGCEYLSASQNRKVFSRYWPGADVASGNDVTCWIIPSLYAAPPVFIVQSDGVAITKANVGKNIDITVGTGNTMTGQSTVSVLAGTLGTTATFPWRIVDVYQGVGNGSDAASSYNWIYVTPNSIGQLGT